MSIQLGTVEVCDLKNGRIMFSPEAIDTPNANNRIQLTVTDGDDIVHKLATTTIDGVFHFEIATGFRPIRTFSVTRLPNNQPIFEAQNLFPSTDREFETQFKSHRDRSGDRHVDYFVASQIFNHFTGQEGYRISAAVVASYKAIELMDEVYLEEAEIMLLHSLAALPQVKLSRSTRNNREHLHISVLCALYHVYLARGNSLEFFRTLQALKEMLEDQSFHSYYNLAYNSALSLRLLTLLYLIAEQPEEARAVADLSFRIFKFSARDADDNLAHFKELRYVHDNTYESMRIARRVKTVNQSLIHKTLQGCLRVSGNYHPQSFQQMTNTFQNCALLLSE